MLGKQDGWNLFVNLIMTSRILKEKRTTLPMQWAEEYMPCILQQLSCIILDLKDRIVDDGC